jgi:integrase/recombinase XerD
MMNELRQKMIDQMLLKGFSERTKKTYLDAVSLLARYYNLAPDKLQTEDLQNWLLYLVKERKLSPATCRVYLNAIRYFYLHVLHWPECDLKLITPKRQQRIPDLLSPAEVQSIIDNAKNGKYRVMFSVCYGCGLRVSELVSLEVKHINGGQHLLQVIQGKGFKDRNIPLSNSLLILLRDYWRLFRPTRYLFCGQDKNKPISITSVQKYFTQSKTRAQINKIGGIHSLRHAYATHQLAAGMAIHQLKAILGHTDLKSTERYLHWQPDTNNSNYDLLAHTWELKS